MNEFTKKELEEIRRCLKYMIISKTTPYSMLTIEVKKKIQCLIDKYHEEAICKGIDEDIKAVTDQGIFHKGVTE